MKRLPLILAALFLAITLARVAAFTSREMSAGLLGWVYAVGLGVAVYTTAYWTRNATTRKAAAVSLVFFILVDALFNFSEVWLTASLRHPLTIAGAIIYGTFPTLATALLGWLQTSIGKLPPTSQSKRINSAISDWIAGKFSVAAETNAVKAPVAAETNNPIPDVRETEPEPSANWRTLPAEDKDLVGNMPTAEIVKRYGVSERTARNWRTSAKNNGYHKVTTEEKHG